MFTCRSSAKVLAAAAATDDEMTIGLRGSKNKEQICRPQSHHHQHQQQTAIPVHTTRNCKMHCIPKATSSSSRCLRDLIFVFPYWTAVNASSQAALPATRDETLVNNKRERYQSIMEWWQMHSGHFKEFSLVNCCISCCCCCFWSRNSKEEVEEIAEQQNVLRWTKLNNWMWDDERPNWVERCPQLLWLLMISLNPTIDRSIVHRPASRGIM